MNPDLERLIQLQRLESTTDDGRRQLAEEPERQRELDARLAAARDKAATAHAQLTDAQSARREREKELAAMQTRLSKFRDQLMDVKTNREYQAMQKEIETAQHEVAALEDRLLEQMLAIDDVQALVKEADAALKREEAEIAVARRELAEQLERVRQDLDRAAAERQQLVAAIPPHLVATFETIRGRRGTAVAEARDGLCAICHVRLRPQIFNEVRRNDSIIQCDSCGRILYFVPAQAPAS